MQLRTMTTKTATTQTLNLPTSHLVLYFHWPNVSESAEKIAKRRWLSVAVNAHVSSQLNFDILEDALS